MHDSTSESKPPLPTFRYIAVYNLVLAIAIALRPRPTWRFLVFLAIFYHNLTVVTLTTGDVDRDVGLSVSLACDIATSFHLLFLSDPAIDFRHTKDSVHPRDLPFFRRVYWAICLQNAKRGIGWNYKVLILCALCRNFHVDAALSYLTLFPL